MDGREPRRIGKPAQGVAQGANGKLDQNLTITGIIVVKQDGGWWIGAIDIEDLDGETDEEAFRRADEGALVLTLEQDIASIEVAQPDQPFADRAIGQGDTGTEVEVIAQAARPHLGRLFGRWRKIGRGRRGGSRSDDLRLGQHRGRVCGLIRSGIQTGGSVHTRSSFD
jgi:hypothetical protein